MRRENLEKCLAIYKKNDRSRHITLPEMKKFLKNELGMKIPTKMNKPEVNKIFNDNLSVATYEKYEDVGRFGMVRMDIQEALGLSLKEARELAKTLEKNLS